MDHVSEQMRAALATAADDALAVLDRVEMLIEIAVGLQRHRHHGSSAYLGAAIALYDRALGLCPETERLLRARITARRATAIQALPAETAADTENLETARTSYLAAIPVLAALGEPEEVAEAEMNHGLVLQALAGVGHARLADAIAAYQRALRTFDRARFPREFAILQNNLATAFLAMPLAGAHGRMRAVREALAVQAFEQALATVTLIDHPVEYAMLHNNLGNALQYASSSHAADNYLRALDAYDEALKVRKRETMPLEYANTISNKANCLWNLPEPRPADHSATDNHHLRSARAYFGEAREIFTAHGERDKALAAEQSCDQIDRELLAGGAL